MKQEFTKELLDNIVTRLKDSLRPEAIYLFGSYASGQATEDNCLIMLSIQDTQFLNLKSPKKSGRSLGNSATDL